MPTWDTYLQVIRASSTACRLFGDGAMTYTLRPFETQLLANETTEAVRNFLVARNRRFATIRWVCVDIVACAMACELTTGIGELTDELASVQPTARSRA